MDVSPRLYSLIGKAFETKDGPLELSTFFDLNLTYNYGCVEAIDKMKYENFDLVLYDVIF